MTNHHKLWLWFNNWYKFFPAITIVHFKSLLIMSRLYHSIKEDEICDLTKTKGKIRYLHTSYTESSEWPQLNLYRGIRVGITESPEVPEFESSRSSRSVLSPSAGKSANRLGELERMSKNYDARRTPVRRRCLSEPMTNLLSPFERVDSTCATGLGGWKESFQPSIPFLARLELCHV